MRLEVGRHIEANKSLEPLGTTFIRNTTILITEISFGIVVHKITPILCLTHCVKLSAENANYPYKLDDIVQTF